MIKDVHLGWRFPVITRSVNSGELGLSEAIISLPTVGGPDLTQTLAEVETSLHGTTIEICDWRGYCWE
jgi:hypothetical protein